MPPLEHETGGVAAIGDGPALVGVAIAEVAENVDLTGQGRVKLRLPWLPGVEPWARVATPGAGAGWGTYFIPQVGDEVLVAFQRGDVRDPYVIGSLWSALARPPIDTPLDARVRRAIVTPVGHTIELHDVKQSVTVRTSTDQAVTLDPKKIELTTATGVSVVLDTAGSVTITAPVKIELKAPQIVLDGTGTVEIKGGATVKVTAGAVCEVQGGLVKIN